MTKQLKKLAQKLTVNTNAHKYPKNNEWIASTMRQWPMSVSPHLPTDGQIAVFSFRFLIIVQLIFSRIILAAKATCHDKQLLTQYHPLCSQLYFGFISDGHLAFSDQILRLSSLILLLSHPSMSMYQP